MQELVRIKSFSSRFDAEVQKALLNSHKIRAFVYAADMGGFRPDLMSGSGGAWLLVAAKDAEQALQILADWS